MATTFSITGTDTDRQALVSQNENEGPERHVGRPDTRQLLSIIVPVFFNQDSIAPLFDEICALEKRLDDRGVDVELIFVDDGSRDQSLARLLELTARRGETIVVTLTRNFGAPAASKIGMKHATGDALIIIAADLQDPVSLVDEMVDRYLGGSRFVIAVRRTRKDPLFSRFAAALYYLLVRRIVIADYPVGGFDMMLLDKNLYREVVRSGPNTNLQLYTYWLGYAPAVIPYDRPARRFGRSRWSLGKRLKLAADTLTGFSVLPIRAISALGLLVSIISFLYGITIVARATTSGPPVPGFPTIVALISFFGGLTLVVLGVIGEYVWRIFDNTARKPEAVVERVYGPESE